MILYYKTNKVYWTKSKHKLYIRLHETLQVQEKCSQEIFTP